MALKTYFKNPVHLFGWTAFSLLLLFILIEGWSYAIKPSLLTQDEHISQRLDEARHFFHQRQQTVYRQSLNLESQVRERIERQFPTSSIYRFVQQQDLFWGVTLYRNGEPYLWDGFAHKLPPEFDFPDKDSSFIDIRKENNVVFWLIHTGFEVTDSSGTSDYQLYATARIEQSNALPIGKSTEYHLSDEFSEASIQSYPVYYNFFNPLPDNISGYRVLSSPAGDSTGVVYSSGNVYPQRITNWEQSVQTWRTIFILICLITFGFIFFHWLDRLEIQTGLFLQIILLSAGWIIFNFIFIPGQWLQFILAVPDNPVVQQNYRLLTDFALDSLFIMLVAWVLYRKIRGNDFELEFLGFPSTLVFGGLAGIGSSLAILAIISKSYHLISRINVTLFKLQLLPSLSTLILLLAFGLMILSLYVVLRIINRFLLNSVGDHFKAVGVTLSVGFMIGLSLSQLFIAEDIRLNWATLLTIFIFVAALGISLMHFLYPTFENVMSPLRVTVLSSILVSLTGIPILYNAHLYRQDDTLQEKAREFFQKEDLYAQKLTDQILRSLEQQYRDITTVDLEKRVPFIQSSFTETVEQSISLLQRNYSIDLQLIRPSGTLVASYSTDLNSPDWIDIYDLPYLTAVIEQQRITRSTNRPVVQLPQLRNQEQYKTFYRGWIPLFGDQPDNPIGWILCSVYQERPNYNKPIRAVMASITSEDWRDSFKITEYQKGKLERNVQQGVTGYFPTHHVLLPQEREALETDPSLYYTSETDDYIYRHYLWKYSPGNVIKVSTIYPDLKTILFEFFKLSFLLLITGTVYLLIYKGVHFRSFHIFGNFSRFQHRILDSFLLATLLFLGILVFTSQYVIRQQNQVIVRQELVDKLESLGSSIESDQKFQLSLGSEETFSLDSLASPLNADASFYSGKSIEETTTPQIYRQHLLQSILPYTVYRELYIDQKNTAIRQVNLASQTLLVGYRSIFSPEGDPVAALSIPTFYHSPKYNQQLLETTSYLIVLYLVVFGIFMGGTVFIARQLTRPLQYIQKGLNKISEGELDTTIPVTSDDEIGSLAAAYNEMVRRLKELRKELAAAEREAAWKEMAQQVAHEIKNPLTPMKLNVQHLKRQLSSGQKDAEELKNNIEKITQNLIDQIQSLNNIASDFSKFSKPIEDEFTEVPVNDIIESVSDLYRHDGNTSIRTELSDKQPVILGVSDELRRAVINLVKNAFEATSVGGQIILRSYINDGSAFIEVEDNGEGISEEDKSKIFVPNFSTKSSGTGLGLAICKKIIEAHEGSISFASIKGEGTTFIIKIPLNHD